MTYNGVGMSSVKGTGLSGYIQRSRVNIQSSFSAGAHEDEEAQMLANVVTPLESSRSVQTNAALAAFLADHDRRRAIKLRVAEYELRRMQDDGATRDVVAAECAAMKASLVAQYDADVAEAAREQKTAAEQRSAKAFAEAFEVNKKKSGAVGDAFNRQQLLEDKQKAEVERRAAAEQKILDRLKRVRLEEPK